jgi:hypothetical protein
MWVQSRRLYGYGRRPQDEEQYGDDAQTGPGECRYPGPLKVMEFATVPRKPRRNRGEGNGLVIDVIEGFPVIFGCRAVIEGDTRPGRG